MVPWASVSRERGVGLVFESMHFGVLCLRDDTS